MRYTILLAGALLACTSAIAGPDNIAPQAKVTASTSLNSKYAAQNVTDGIIGVTGKGQWACEGQTTDWGYVRFPWIQLEWDKPQSISKVILYDRPELNEHVATTKLVFSDGSFVWANQIPNNGTARVVKFTARTVKWVKFVVTDGTGKDIGFSEIEVFPSSKQYADYVSWVDPYIETNRGRFFFFTTGCRPFGMLASAPMTRNKNQGGGGYNYNENEILSFPQIHDWMLSGIEVMPALQSTPVTKGQEGWKSEFSHDDELVQPGYHRVYLRNHKVWVEQTSTNRVGFYKFRYTDDLPVQIITNLGGFVSNSTMANARVKKISDKEFEGSFSSIKRYWGGPKDVRVFFSIKFDKPYKALAGWKGSNKIADVNVLEGDSVGVAAQYDVKAGDEILMKIGLSYTSVENAKNNMAVECSTWDFDKVCNESRTVWNDWLGRMQVTGGTTDQKVKFYTDLWHVLLGRHMNNDVNGDYPDNTEGTRDGNFTNNVFKVRTLPKGKDGKPRYNMYNSDAWWLTQWNLNVLWGLAWPEVQDEMSASMLQYAENGKLLPRGPAGGGYSYIMTSCPATNLIVGTYMKGLLTKYDIPTAFDAVKRNALPGGMLGAADDIKFYTEKGYWPDNAGITVEAVFQDFAIAQMAKKLGKTDDYNFFTKRSKGWKNLFDPEQKLLFPKNREGKFAHKNPLSGAGWIEANAWQATWCVSHDIPGLARLMGGNDVLTEKLNHAFEKAEPSDFVFDYSSGYISYANQPGLSDAHVFNYAGKPWLTQYWVRRVQDKAYGGTTPDIGYGGQDEDQGQMGGLSVLMAIGLFNLQGNVATTPVYDITSPIFDKVVIKLDPEYYPGKQFVITTHNNSKDNVYIQKATLNGKALNKFWFTHAEYAKGGQLELWLGPKPNKAWGVAGLPVAN
ncbi:glycoside hydrolase family 92 protein [Mucilaginibacter limnophilus]|uniref:Glycoside hydrolase family 92 protein n=1 Tax=Mucilaginibacter limnophilus TaxID=1932778 RepID=A0A3S2VKU2_9SPHI|nr:GH92 family glycosyl hydrolase [Mucilaginibacter limnophilus]RVT98348.1 glycoside hydrolase family 92 protein [Mucilaginibacter limnophilus]